MARKARVVSTEGVYEKSTLKNGLRVVTERLPWVRSVSIGVWIDVGSRNEKPEENGLSHFVEHMVFKGTKRRNAREVASSLEPLGGSLNAFTSREQTCYIARILDDHLEEAVDVLADITCNATLTPTNLKREKTVICEEIKESQDNPSDKIHDNFSTTFWGDHPLGRPIMGQQENVLGMTRSRMVGYIKRHYRKGSVVVAASGSVSHRKLVKLVQEKLTLPDGVAEPAESARRDGGRVIRIEQNDSFQTHLCVGFPGLPYHHHDKMAAMCLNAYLGGGMSSVLFQKIREERGLAYSVYTYHDFYRDSGILGAYLGTDATRVREAFGLIMQELDKVKRRKLPETKLSQIKTQIKGHLTLGMESTSTRMNRVARQELMTGDYMSLKQVMRMVDRVTNTQVRDLANRLLDSDNMAVAVLGPVDKNAFDDVA